MPCLTNLEFSLAPATAAALWAVCALILASVMRNNRFAGQPAFVLTFLAMLWWLFTVTMDLASPGESCKVGWSLAAWPGITLLPIAWTFFVFDYTMNASRRRRPIRLLLYIGLPSLVSLIALTNSQTHLLYGTGTRLVTEDGRSFVYFDHGPLFFTVAAGLYIFVCSALGVLVYALIMAKRIIRPFLSVLIVVTSAPLAGNLAYVLGEVTVFGFDPTPFLFAVSLIALSWLLLNNTMMDTAAQGRNLLFYVIQDPVIIIDAAGRFASANPAARALFNKKMLKHGESIERLERIGPFLQSFIETGVFDSTDPIRLRGRIFEPRIRPIDSPIQTKTSLLGWSVSLVDITEREHAAEALREALAHAKAANHAKSQFLAMISHELRTPLTSIKGGLDLALHGATGELNEPLRNLLTIAQRNSLRLMKLVDDVLDLQKLDLSTITLELRDLDADAFLHDVIEEYEAYATEADVRLVMVSEPVNRQVRVDPDRLKQVVGNVISNAVKFSPEGGRVECSTRRGETMLRVSIRDSGIGIPENKEDQVFGRFHQVESSAAKASGGSGLGMHIAKILIERMGGAICYESRLGHGTTFHIDIPFAPQAAPEVAAVPAGA
ncbi:histidine kinase N-terminal 7TM domain-containing protein [Paenirhodobacter hankyongi]|uniref:histidine kinase n=1 Tax=Paenirhodobacter hankyongi TaxID=2294033 RepID=A0A421BRW9_9RHOB|nr:histidine kinase N-terminal 7TM domain-containing protein [Sinirhodobacter hankyongi]RLL71020.1 hybrid sensor histidine kinase/response regulator [Sinirhodobacter hankyongi]